MQRKQKRTNKPMKTKTKVSAPSAKTIQIQNRGPAIRSNGRHLCISHREYLAEISGKADFTVTGYLVNPGLSDTMPWASAIASRFEYYRITRLVLEYVSRCPSTVRGTLSMAFDKDVRDNPPTSYREFMNYMGAKSSSPWNSFNCPASSEFFGPNRLFTRALEVPNTDQRLYDWGKLLIGVQGDAVQFGDLYISYDIEFSVPELHDLVDPSLPPSEPGVTITVPASTTTVGGSLPLTNSSVEAQTPVSTLASIVGDTGTFLTDSRLAIARGNLRGLRGIIENLVNVDSPPCCPGDLRAPPPTTHEALLLPKGVYHIEFYAHYLVKNIYASAASFVFMMNTMNAGQLSCFLLEDAVNDHSPYTNVNMSNCPSNLDADYTAGSVSGYKKFTSSTIATNATIEVGVHVSFDYRSDGATPTCPVLVLPATASYPYAADNGAKFVISDVSTGGYSGLEIAITQ